MEKKLAIIDIGSNTIRLVIYLVKHGYYKEIKNIKVAARLQTYLTNEMMLTNDGITKLLDTLLIFKEILTIHEVLHVKVVATATIRQSKNQKDIKQNILDKVGFDVDILSGEKEAFYGYLSTVNSTNLESGITIDLGGGSTEITKFVNREIINSTSLPFGILSLNEKFLKDHMLKIYDIHKLTDFLHINLMKLDWLQNCRLPIIGIGGSARNFGKINQAMNNYPLNSIQQYEMKINHMVSINEELNKLSYEGLQQIEGLSKERADIIIPAIQVFLSLAKIVKAPFFQTSQKGIREGILLEEISSQQTIYMNLNQLIEKSLVGIGLAYFIDMGKRAYVTKTALMLADSLQKQGLTTLSQNDIKYLRLASYVFNIGEFIENESSYEHTFYMLSNQSIDGLTHRERIKIALLASYNSKSDFKRYVKAFKEWYSKDERQKMKLLGAILKFAYVINQTNRKLIKSINFINKKESIDIEIYCDKKWYVEQHLAEKQLKHLENVLQSKLNLHFLSSK